MARMRFPKIAVSTIIAFIATRVGVEPILSALGIGPNAIRLPGRDANSQEDTARGLRLLWMGAASLLASALRVAMAKLASIPIFAQAMRICARRAERSTRNNAISSN